MLIPNSLTVSFFALIAEGSSEVNDNCDKGSDFSSEVGAWIKLNLWQLQKESFSLNSA